MKRLILSACLLLAACDVTGKRVLVTGDSNASLSADAFNAYLYGGFNGATGGWFMPAPGYLLSLAAVPGAALKDSAMWVPALNSVRDNAEFDAVLVSIGGNDGISGQCTNPATLAAHIDAFYGALPEDVPLLILDAAYMVNPMYSFSCLVNVNLALQSAHGRWSATRTMVYINVNDILNALPAGDRYMPDGAHYSIKAKYAIAEKVRQELEAVL